MPRIDDDLLDELEKEDPDLVAQYRAKMGFANDDLASAKKAQRLGGYADAAGQAFTDIGNANKKDIILKNRMQDMGKRPGVVEARQDEWKSVMPAFDRQVDSAKGDRDDAFKQFGQDVQIEGYEKKREMDDPSSETSQKYRDYIKTLSPTAAQMPGLDKMSANEISNFAPGFQKRMELETMAAAKREAAQAAAQARRDTLNVANGAREDARNNAAAIREESRNNAAAVRQENRDYKAQETEKSNLEKKKAAMLEVEDRRTSIQQNLSLLKEKIGDKGTYELTGSHNQDVDRLVDAIATDMAKLADPTSVARPSEVDQVKKNLVQSGFRNKNSTALQVIDNFSKEVDTRADSAYKIRGLESPAKGAPGGGQGPTFNRNDIEAEMKKRGLRK